MKTTKNIDLEGLVILNVIEKADNFNEWMYDKIKLNCSGRTLEIGSGIGNISNFFVRDNKEIVLSDLRDNYCDILKGKFRNEVLKINLVDSDFENKYKDLMNSFDSVFALNVVEHIEDDVLAIQNCKKLLKKGGKLTILVPSYQWLFCGFDQELEHYRRYTRKKLNSIINKNNLKIDKTFYFNSIGILGWFFSGKILKKKTIPEGQMSFFNTLVPVFKFADFLSFRKIGLSVICFSTK
jgi:SAM-dependent methyltransferase